MFFKMTIKSYAGIGSRRTPAEVLLLMTKIAFDLKDHLTLNSGAAPGADMAFEDGAGSNKVIFVPWNGFSGKKMQYPIPPEAFEMASKAHKAWPYLSSAVRSLMARNCQQVLGKNLDDPVEFVICWTPDGCEDDKTRTRDTGGTGLAITIASWNAIPVFNLQNDFSRHFVLETLIPNIVKNGKSNN